MFPEPREVRGSLLLAFEKFVMHEALECNVSDRMLILVRRALREMSDVYFKN